MGSNAETIRAAPANRREAAACECPALAALEKMPCRCGNAGEEGYVVCDRCEALAAPCPCAGMPEHAIEALGEDLEDAVSDGRYTMLVANGLRDERDQLRAELNDASAEASKLLEYARTVKGSRDVHSIYEVLDLVPTLRAELAASQERERAIQASSDNPDVAAAVREVLAQARTNTAATRRRLLESESGPNCKYCGRDLVFCICNAVGPSADLKRRAESAEERERVLREKLERVYRIASGEDQVADDDTEGMAEIAALATPEGTK